MLGTGPQLAPVEAMTYAAACTERLRLGCVVFVSTLYSPVHLAKSLSTLDQLSQGRTEIGVGTGGPARPFAAFGVAPQAGPGPDAPPAGPGAQAAGPGAQTGTGTAPWPSAERPGTEPGPPPASPPSGPDTQA